MHVLALMPAVANLANVLISNDDGWAEINIRQLYSALTDTGFSALISAPADNESGTGSLDADPTVVGSHGCEFQSCQPGSPPTGKNVSMTRFNYVNSYPVTSVKYGIQEIAPNFFDGSPDITVTGFNVGCNLGLAVFGSGTVGAAVESAKEGIPAVAFSGCSGSQTGWDQDVPDYTKVYAQLSAKVTKALVLSGKPYLPRNTWLNVNFPKSTGAVCRSADDFKFVLSRILPAVPVISDADVVTCGNGGRLPTEGSVTDASGCFASISVGRADTKLTANATVQGVVLDKLGSLLSCLPSSQGIKSSL